MDDDTVVVCSRIADAKNIIGGAVSDQCADCDTFVWVSPSSFDVLAEGAVVICWVCFNERLAADSTEAFKIQRHPNEEQQIAELEEYRRRKRSDWR